MLIDWFTVIAQIVNFLILVILLKYLLYDRVIQAMDRREERLHNRLEEAKDKKAEAEEEAESFRKKKKEMEDQRQDMLSRAKKEAEEERKSLTRRAREEADGLRKRWREAVEKEKESFLKDIKRTTLSQVYSVSRRAFQDLADAEIEKRIAEVFVSRLGDLPRDKREEMAEAAGKGGDPLEVKSGFDISTKMQRKITEAVHREIAEGVDVGYRTDPDLIMGIEMKARGVKVAWNLNHYLADLEERAGEILDREARAGEERAEREEEEREPEGKEDAKRDESGSEREEGTE